MNDERTLDVRVSAALYLCRIEHQKDTALRSLSEVIARAPNASAAKGRAWANLFLLGSGAKAIEGALNGLKLDKKDQQTLALFRSRLE